MTRFRTLCAPVVALALSFAAPSMSEPAKTPAAKVAPGKEPAAKGTQAKEPVEKAATEKSPTAKAPAAKAATEKPATDAPVPAGVQPTAPSAEKANRPTAIESRVVVKVKSADDARKAILTGLAELGGYASLITDNALDLKVQPESMPAVLNLVAAQGVVLDKTLGRTDLTLELATLDGQIKSKRAILAQLRDLFDGSDVNATLQIESSMNDLVKELEGVKGRLRVMTDKARWAVVHVSFNFYEQQRINYVDSRFEWLNSVKLERFMEEF